MGISGRQRINMEITLTPDGMIVTSHTLVLSPLAVTTFACAPAQRQNSRFDSHHLMAAATATGYSSLHSTHTILQFLGLSSRTCTDNISLNTASLVPDLFGNYRHPAHHFAQISAAEVLQLP